MSTTETATLREVTLDDIEQVSKDLTKLAPAKIGSASPVPAGKALSNKQLAKAAKDAEKAIASLGDPSYHDNLNYLAVISGKAELSYQEIGENYAAYCNFNAASQVQWIAARFDSQVKFWEARGKKFDHRAFAFFTYGARKGQQLDGRQGFIAGMFAFLTLFPEQSDIMQKRMGNSRDSKASKRLVRCCEVYKDAQDVKEWEAKVRRGEIDPNTEESPKEVKNAKRRGKAKAKTETESDGEDGEVFVPDTGARDLLTKPSTIGQAYTAMWQAAGDRKVTLKSGAVLYYRDVLHVLAMEALGTQPKTIEKWESEPSKQSKDSATKKAKSEDSEDSDS